MVGFLEINDQLGLVQRFSSRERQESLGHFDVYVQDRGESTKLANQGKIFFNFWWAVPCFYDKNGIPFSDTFKSGSFEVRTSVPRDILQAFISNAMDDEGKSSMNYMNEDEHEYCQWVRFEIDKKDPLYDDYRDRHNLAKDIMRLEKPILFDKVLLVFSQENMVKVVGKPVVFSGSRRYHAVATMYNFRGELYAIINVASGEDSYSIAYKYGDIKDVPCMKTLEKAYESVYREEHPAVSFVPSRLLLTVVNKYVKKQKENWKNLDYSDKAMHKLKKRERAMIQVILDTQEKVLFVAACHCIIQKIIDSSFCENDALIVSQFPRIIKDVMCRSLNWRSMACDSEWIDQVMKTDSEQLVSALQMATGSHTNEISLSKKGRFFNFSLLSCCSSSSSGLKKAKNSNQIQTLSLVAI